MSIRNFSRIAASNATVDNINFSENQAANTLNDSARELMSDIAEWRDDSEGALTSSGAANAYTLTTFQNVPSLVTGVQIAFKASFANTAAATLNVDTRGAKAIRKFTTSGEVAIEQGDIVLNGHYTVRYDAAANAAAGAWILLNPSNYLSNSPWADLASAATTDLSTVTGGNIRVTGTVTITSLGTAASGVTKLLRFAASLTITHNATSLICFGGANIITAAGDIAEVRSLGSGNWVMTQFDRFSGLGAWTTVASAATIDLGAQTSRNIALSGTTGITSFGSTATPDNVPFNVRATGAITLTHSANLICPGGANLTLASGDTFTVVQEAAGVWRIIGFQFGTNPSNAIAVGTAASNLVRLTSGSTTTGTYSRTGTTVTVTITAHGYTTGQFATLTFTTGTATSGTYQVTSTGANTFTVVDTISGTTSGNVSAQGPVALPAVDGSQLTGISNTAKAWVNFHWNGSAVINNSSFNVSSITRNGLGDYTINFTNSFPNTFYGMFGYYTDNTTGSGLVYPVASGVSGSAPALKTTSQIRIRTGYTGFTSDPLAASSVWVGFL